MQYLKYDRVKQLIDIYICIYIIHISIMVNFQFLNENHVSKFSIAMVQKRFTLFLHLTEN